MDPTLLTDAARAAHLIGLAVGFGLAIWADLTALSALVRPLGPADIRSLHRLHRGVTLGLAILWASGLVLLALRTGLDPEHFSPKLMAKLGVVLLLTGNALALGALALPLLAQMGGSRFGELPFRRRLVLASVAGVSFACWVSALSLGVFSQMKAMDFALLRRTLGIVYATGLGGALLIALAAPLVGWIASRAGAAGDLADLHMPRLLSGRP